MSGYPGEIDTFRNTANIQGVEYNAADTTTAFAEDYNGHSAAIIAIQETLGEDPQGDYPTVGDRIAAAGGGGGAWELVEQVIATGSQYVLEIDGLDLATDEAYMIAFAVQNNYGTTTFEAAGASLITPTFVGQRFEGGGATTQSGLYFASHPALGPGVGQLLLEKTPNGAAAGQLNYTVGSSRNYFMQGMFGNWSGAADNMTKFRIKASTGNVFVTGSKITAYRRLV